MTIEKTATESGDVAAQGWQESGWFAALTLSERAATLQASKDVASSDPQPQTPQGARRFQSWKALKPFEQENIFAERLALDGLTEDDLALLLTEPSAVAQARHLRLAPPPPWLLSLKEAFALEPPAEEFIQVLLAEQQLTPYLHPLIPLLHYGLQRLYAGVQRLCQQFPGAPFEPQHIVQVLFAPLPERVQARLSRTFVMEMHIARLQQRLRGENTEERFQDFVRQLSDKKNILSLLEEYPTLARQLVLTVEHWEKYALEFLVHLCNDWPVLCATFAPEDQPGRLIKVKSGVGDPHRQGRSVLVLTFHSGLQLLYKPKSLAIDLHFQELLSWLNEQGVRPTFQTIKLLARGSYGWSEFVAARSCSTREEVTRFYERQGSYLALLYALNAIDVHGENVIAAGEHPMLVDLEALFHPQVAGEDPTQPYSLGLLSMDQSVFRVGLLPHRIWSNQETIGVDLSGLGGEEGQLTPHQLPGWEAKETDQMRLIRQRVVLPELQNRPHLNESEINVLDYSEAISTGFIQMYRLLQEKREQLLAHILPRFAHDEIRLLIRPSQRYAKLLSESFHPDLLRDALDRDRFFDHLWREVPLRPYLARAIPAEHHDLLQGDIPMFTTSPASRTITTSTGAKLPNFFDESSLELVIKRFQQLGEHDMEKQVWVIKAAMATLVLGPEQLTGKSVQFKPSCSPVNATRLLDAAHAVGERLEQLAMRNDYGACWLGLSPINQQAWSLLPTDMDLYSGTSGIALFLGYLGAVTGEARYRRLAELALETVRSLVEQRKKNLETGNVGVFEDLGSVIHLLVHLSQLWQQPALLQEAEGLSELLPPLIVKDEHLDVISGSAGCILNLLNLYALRPSPRTLEIARLCGERLLVTAQSMENGSAWVTIKRENPLGGFAHGTAGIAFSLFKLAALSKDERYQRLAQAALAYDRSLFVPEKQNWADLRTFPSLRKAAKPKPLPDPAELRALQASMVAWCYGAAGIGFGRLGCLPYLDDAEIREEIAIALNTTLAEGIAENHSLCHGALGNIDLVLTAMQILPELSSRYAEPFQRATATILDSIDESGWACGVPCSVETPGLLTGLAGIGYELLRLARPEAVPSLLLLVPPPGC